MPKVKTHRGAAKRFRKTASGRIKVRRANRAHINTKMSSKSKRHLRTGSAIDKADVPSINRMLAGC